MVRCVRGILDIMGSIGYTEANRALFLLKGEQLCLNEEKTRRNVY